MSMLAKKPASFMREYTQQVRDHSAAMARITDSYYAGLKRLEAKYFADIKELTDAFFGDEVTEPTVDSTGNAPPQAVVS